MDWRLKACIMRVLDVLPGQEFLRHLGQRYVTRSVPRKVRPIDNSASDINLHLRAFRTYYEGNLSEALYFEFGAGWDLYTNIYLYIHGIDHQLVVDIDKLVRRELVNHVIRQLAAAVPERAKERPLPPLGEGYLRDLKENYGIRYLAPVELSELKLSDGSVDLVSTTNTLEHVPAGKLAKIMRMCRRTCRPDGVVSMRIDYSDHYSHVDSSITPYNFLQFTSDEWQRYNSGMLYQNRLQHRDYLRLFRDAGLEILREESSAPEGAEHLIGTLELAPRFQRYPISELAPTEGWFVVRPADRASPHPGER